MLSFTWGKIARAWKKAGKKTVKKSKFRFIDARVERNEVRSKFKPLKDVWEHFENPVPFASQLLLIHSKLSCHQIDILNLILLAWKFEYGVHEDLALVRVKTTF